MKKRKEHEGINREEREGIFIIGKCGSCEGKLTGAGRMEGRERKTKHLRLVGSGEEGGGEASRSGRKVNENRRRRKGEN